MTKAVLGPTFHGEGSAKIFMSILRGWAKMHSKNSAVYGPKVVNTHNFANIFSQYSMFRRYLIGCQLLLITNRKSHTGFRLLPTSMTLKHLERRNSPYFAFFSEFDRFAGRLSHSG